MTSSISIDSSKLIALALLALMVSASPVAGASAETSAEIITETSADAATSARTEKNPDPWERFNRRMHRFNDVADRFMVRPIAKVYRKVPKPIKRSAGNVFGNVRDVGDGVNNILQGKIKNGLSDFLRVTINTTIGLGGLFDPASRMGLNDHQEDFGQTLASWGMPPGPYVVLPFLGPTTLRDAVSRPMDTSLDAVRFLEPVAHRNSVYGLRLVHGRSELLAVEGVMFGDRYLFIRNAYLQRREFLVNDGEVDDPFGDEF